MSDNYGSNEHVLQNKKYIRNISNEQNELIKVLIEKYNVPGENLKSLIFPSGLMAISIAVETYFFKYKNKKINFVYSNQLYIETIRLFKYLENIYNVNLYEFDMTNHETDILKISEMLNENENNINILFSESCSNPDGIMFNYDIVLKLKNDNWHIIIDNTWLSYLLQNPFNYVCDVVVLSLTKYYSGGNAICGALITKKNYEDYFMTMKMRGSHVSPIVCNIVKNNMLTLNDRILNASTVTIKVIEMLLENNMNIKHPFVTEKIKKEKNKFLSHCLYPSVFVMTINMNVKTFKNIMKEKIINIEYKTSYGGKNSRICNFPKSNKNDNEKTDIRISIGYSENPERIFNELKKVFIE